MNEQSIMGRPRLVIVGPTAVGKTALSLRLAVEFDGEIVSADSRLFYRGMDIGTAKPTPEELARVPHHLIDICEPDETVTLASFQGRAYRAIDAIHAHGRLPMLVGGTGQYVRSVIEGWGVPAVAPRPRLREALAQLGQEELARWIEQLDPVAAERLDLRNLRRVIRALEVTLVTGKSISSLQVKSPPHYEIARIGLRRERGELYRRIDARVDHMMASGFLEEVRNLHARGYGRELPAMSALGYKQIWAHLDGEITREAAVERIKFETHRFVRQQATWFRQDDPGLAWFDASDLDLEAQVVAYVQEWLDAPSRG